MTQGKLILASALIMVKPSLEPSLLTMRGHTWTHCARAIGLDNGRHTRTHRPNPFNRQRSIGNASELACIDLGDQ